MSVQGFPTLIPAFRLKLKLNTPITSAPSSLHPAGLTLVSVPSGTLKSEPNYPIKIDAESINLVDVIKQDNADSSFLRIDVRGFLRDIPSNTTFSIAYTGHIKVNAAIALVLAGSPDAKTTDFANILAHVKFAAGGALEELEEELYVAGGRFVIEDDGMYVEYTISQIQG